MPISQSTNFNSLQDSYKKKFQAMMGAGSKRLRMAASTQQQSQSQQ